MIIMGRFTLSKQMLSDGEKFGRDHADEIAKIIGDNNDRQRRAAMVQEATAQIRENVVGSVTAIMRGLGATDADIRRYVDAVCLGFSDRIVELGLI
jgi:predicted transcriptional regulator